MANIIKRALESGFRLINASELNRWRDDVNNAFSGVTAFANLNSNASGLTATGTNQATALALGKQVNTISTAAASTGVALPSAAVVGVGAYLVIFNNGASPIKVYGANGTTDTIDGTAGSTGKTLTNALRCMFFVTAAGVWTSAQLGVTSA